MPRLKRLNHNIISKHAVRLTEKTTGKNKNRHNTIGLFPIEIKKLPPTWHIHARDISVKSVSPRARGASSAAGQKILYVYFIFFFGYYDQASLGPVLGIRIVHKRLTPMNARCVVNGLIHKLPLFPFMTLLLFIFITIQWNLMNPRIPFI